MKSLIIILTLVLTLTFPNLSFGQTAPNLGTTSTFAVFTAVGAVTNDGVSTLVTGDLGTDVGTISGFATGQVVGNIRDENSPESAQAAADVQVAYNQLLANSCGTTLNPEIGGQTLTSGVYCQSTASASTLCGTLTLSGPGVFIIKLNSALTTCTDSKIVLINGATAENVFFQVNGAVNLGINSMFSGTIVANGAISLLTGARLQGRALSIGGAISLNGNQVNSTPDLTPSIFSNGGTYNSNGQKDIVIAVFNVGSDATTGPVTFEFNKLTPSFTITVEPNATTSTVTTQPTVNNSEWTFTEEFARYVVTLKDGFSIPAGGNKKIVIRVTATNNPNAAATITARVFNGTGGGETPTTNNSAVYLISINNSNN